MLATMKYIFFVALLLFTVTSHAQSGRAENTGNLIVSFKVKNNSILGHRYALIGYEPSAVGNWTNIFFLLPGLSRKYKCPVGTKIYRANDQQVGTVMGGGSIRDDKPFLMVKAEDVGKVFRLNQ